MERKIYVIKKDGSLQNFNPQKIVDACAKSAERAMATFSEEKKKRIIDNVTSQVTNRWEMDHDENGVLKIPVVPTMHYIVEKALDETDPDIAKCYRDFRNYKEEFIKIINKVYKKSNEMMFTGDKDNANADSSLVSTQRALEEQYLSRELYRMYLMSQEERDAVDAGYIYVHDMGSRRNSANCCLFDVKSVLSGGFEMGNIWYNEPKSLDVAFDVIGDITLMAASQQYGGFTIPEIDKLLAPYAEKTYQKEFAKSYAKYVAVGISDTQAQELADKEATEQVQSEMKQGFQGLEMKLNTVASSRGDYPFTTMSFGLGTDKWEKLASLTCLEVRKNGQGKEGFKRPVLFPKLVFLYTENLHAEGKVNEDLFNAAIECSGKACYPDYTSLDGDTHLSEMYHKYGLAISPMGCRAYLTPWYERGGMIPADEEDKPVFVGRSNIGVVSLNLPMIYAKAERSNENFYEVLDYYLGLIRNIHIRTKKYLGNMKASINPLGFCEGGFYNGHLGLNDKIAPVIECWTASFGVTALNELQQLYNGQSLAEASREYLAKCDLYGAQEMDGELFCLDVLKYIDNYCNKWKHVDGIPYAVYGTPAESLCYTQVNQFRQEFGPNDAITSKSYVSNSFHCFVGEDITGIEKQDLEHPFWKYAKGGRIQYVKYPIGYNDDAMKTLVRRAMKLGYYEGVNLSLSYCNQCGSTVTSDVDMCPCCGTKDITKIERMNGYLAFSRVHGSTRLNRGKMDEIRDRKSM